ncbi:MAG: hypothetical protein ACREFQ_17200, partial [Stellaceae bacterium]
FQPPLSGVDDAPGPNGREAIPPEPPPSPIAQEDDLVLLERRFLEAQQRLLAEGCAAEEDEEPVRPERTASHGLAPEADLRTLKLRLHAHDADMLDGLFVQKRAAADAAPASWIEEHTAAIGVGPSAPEPPTIAEGIAAPPRERPRKRARPFPAPMPVAIVALGIAALLVSAGPVLLYHPRAPIMSAPAVQHSAAPPADPRSAAGDDFLARGEHSLKTGDVAAARLYYERAANLGNALGAFMVGATFDPTFLVQLGVRGFEGDVKTASAWFGRARDLIVRGAPEPPAIPPRK